MYLTKILSKLRQNCVQFKTTVFYKDIAIHIFLGFFLFFAYPLGCNSCNSPLSMEQKVSSLCLCQNSKIGSNPVISPQNFGLKSGFFQMICLGELTFWNAWGEVGFGEEYRTFDFAWGELWFFAQKFFCVYIGGICLANLLCLSHPKWQNFEKKQQINLKDLYHAVQCSFLSRFWARQKKV